MNNKIGSKYPSPSGVPQGSALGPLLFIVYMLDLPPLLPPDVSYKIYADDLKLYATEFLNMSSPVLQHAIEIVGKWREENNMIISVSKCASLTTLKKTTCLPLKHYRDSRCWQGS